MSIYFFDTETTDRKPPMEIIEAAWLKVLPELGLFSPSDTIPAVIHYEEWSQRYHPSAVPLTFGAMAVHHILPSDLEGMPPSSTFALPADAEYLIGHSVDFDWAAAGSPNVKRICTDAMARHVYPGASGYSLVALIYLLCGPTETTRSMVRHAHGALTDCQLDAILLRHILNDMPVTVKTWAELWAFSEECRIPRTCPMKKYEGVLLEDLDEGFVDWCLNQSWLDPYFRKGLERVNRVRYGENGDPSHDVLWEAR